MRRLAVILMPLICALLTSCAQMTAAQARATAVVAGCWPYGAAQPATATPRPTATLAPGGAAPTAAPTEQAYPACTPAPQTPTLPPSPTPAPTLIPRPTAQPPAALGGRLEIGDVPGVVDPRRGGEMSTLQLAAFPGEDRVAVGFVSFGATPDDKNDGQVWVRVETPTRTWGVLQTVNTAPVSGFFGGLGLAVTPDGAVAVAYGHGGALSNRSVVLATSADGGATWSDPAPVAGLVGRVVGLEADAAGGLHLLVVRAATGVNGDVIYAERRAGGAWQVSTVAPASAVPGGWRGAQLALLPRADGALRRIVVANAPDQHHLVVARSDDGASWVTQPLPTGQLLGPEIVASFSLVAAPRSDGDLVAVAWGQYAQGLIAASVSLDGGATWGPEERVVQFRPDGALWDAAGEGRGPFGPQLAYERTTDTLALIWNEEDMGADREHTYLQAGRLAGRALAGDTAWRWGITPQRAEDVTPPALTPLGRRVTAVAANGDQTRHWIAVLDERNQQYRVEVQSIHLPRLLVEDVS